MLRSVSVSAQCQNYHCENVSKILSFTEISISCDYNIDFWDFLVLKLLKKGLCEESLIHGVLGVSLSVSLCKLSSIFFLYTMITKVPNLFSPETREIQLAFNNLKRKLLIFESLSYRKFESSKVIIQKLLEVRPGSLNFWLFENHIFNMIRLFGKDQIWFFF